jgi:hypothetical protein
VNDDLEALTHRPGPGSHRTTLVIDGSPVETLADLPPLRDRLLIVAQILPQGTPIETADDALVAAGHGVTDLLKQPTARDTATDNELRAGVGPLWQKIAIWRPAAVVFVYKRGAEIAAGRSLAEPWGQLVGVALSGRPCFLMPGPYAASEQVAPALNFFRNLGASLPR